jgi:Glycosyltransferase family 28 N-terminal domain
MDARTFEEAKKAVDVALEDDVDVPDDKSMISSLADADAPPAFGDGYGSLKINNDSLDTRAIVTEDGRINIAFSEKQRRLSKLAPLLNETLSIPKETLALLDTKTYDDPPPLKIVIQIIGSRGDIQPFIALGQVLKRNGHFVRVATHPTFEKFVKENGLDFYSIGGDPAELMS